MTLSQKSLANVCLFCGEGLSSPSMCTFCGFKFCNEHKSTENHQCIKTRYSEYVKKNTSNSPNISKGKFRVVCEMCGFTTTKGAPIEYAGEELVQHTQLVGCTGKVFLEEVKEPQNTQSFEPISGDGTGNQNLDNQVPDSTRNSPSSNQTSIVDQIIKLGSLKEKGIISEQEFSYIKSELLKRLR